MKKFGFATAVIAFALLFNANASQAITYGSEITNASYTYPSVVSIWNESFGAGYKTFVCTGNLISPTVVLTAAHCVLPQSDGYLYVGYGADRLDEVTTFSDVEASWKHPRYSKNLLVNDIGLLLLPAALPESLVSPLPTSQSIQNALKASKGNYEIAGWGVDQNGESATYLKHTYVSDQTLVARKTLGWNNKVWLAVGKFNKTEKIYSGACNGDSGGPLYALASGKKTLIGLTSWGAADCELGKPSVYTRLSYYLSDVQTGLVRLKVNAKTDNRLPAPTVISHTKILGEVNSEALKALNTYTCAPAKAGPNDTVSLKWFWGSRPSSDFFSNQSSVAITVDQLKSHKDYASYSPSSTFGCNATVTGPSGLTTEDYSILTVSISPPPSAIVTATKNYDANFSYLLPSSCKANSDYPNQVMKWIVTSEGGWGSFADSSYPSDVIVVGVGPIFRYTMQNISNFSNKWLYCVVERQNALGVSIGAASSSYTWSSVPEYFLSHPGSLPIN